MYLLKKMTNPCSSFVVCLVSFEVSKLGFCCIRVRFMSLLFWKISAHCKLKQLSNSRPWRFPFISLIKNIWDSLLWKNMKLLLYFSWEKRSSPSVVISSSPADQAHNSDKWSRMTFLSRRCPNTSGCLKIPAACQTRRVGFFCQSATRQNNFRRHHFSARTLLQQAGFNQSALHPLRELLLLSRPQTRSQHTALPLSIHQPTSTDHQYLLYLLPR